MGEVQRIQTWEFRVLGSTLGADTRSLGSMSQLLAFSE